jgi:endogenous inhibitor of DNA gyrase (YacG/DUF329 family)
MGDRYFLTVKCPKCGQVDNEVYYAPTCDFTTHKCKCGQIIDLEEYSGISYEEASNRDVVAKLIRKRSLHRKAK